LDGRQPEKFKMDLLSTERSRQLSPQYGKGNFAVNSRTDWRSRFAMSSRQTGFFLCDFRLGGCYKVNMTPDSELLRRYAGTKSEEAFAELVRRHLNLVYSAALRQVNGDAHLAQDVAQMVFTDLARKAASLAHRATLTGWLYTSAHFAAAKAVRTEQRRRAREQEAHNMRKTLHPPAPDPGCAGGFAEARPDWEKLRLVLDEAMHELKETDREAILLRYFKNQQFTEIGEKFGLNENAARMRVERALEKLRAVFLRRGIAATTALASVISANAVQIAPAGLAATLTNTSLAAAGTGTTLTLLKLMTMTKLKLGLSALVVAGATTALVVQHQAQEKLRAENESLTQQIAQLKTDNENLSNRLAAAGGSKSLSDEQLNELLKLRGEVGRLRGQANQLEKLQEENRRWQASLAKANHLPATPDADPESSPEKQAAIARMSDAKLLCLGLLMYTSDHQDQLPPDLNQIPQSLTNTQPALTGTNQFELVAQGRLTGITNPSEAIVVRETEAHLLNGKLVKAYGFADGHAQLMNEPPEGFDAWELEHMVAPPANQ
jgi:RNA polymerase sigma factor (sigma-70 family)